MSSARLLPNPPHPRWSTLPPLWRAATLFLLASAAALPPQALGAPRTPSDDNEVLERVPARATDPAARALAEQRQKLARQPRDAEAAAALAAQYVADALAEGDPRAIGRAQAALAPWWKEPAPPAPVRLQRAVIRQFGHEFEAAQADLQGVVAADPGQAKAWSWIAAIALVQADYERARRACAALVEIASELTAQSCIAAIDSVTGRAADAARTLDRALTRAKNASPPPSAEECLWVYTRLAEARLRIGDHIGAERAFIQGLAMKVPDVYLQAAYADHLLERQRGAEVLKLLAGRENVDLLLLRLAEAAKLQRDPRLRGWTDELRSRFSANEARGDTTHRKEQARFALHVLGEPRKALPLAVQNWQQQKEPADAQLLLEAAVAAGDSAAAQPVVQWLHHTGHEDPRLRDLASRLKSGRP